MSVVVQKAEAKFFEPENGQHRFQFSAELLGHSELQSDLLRVLFNAKSRTADVVIGTLPNGHEAIDVFVSADEDEVKALLRVESTRRKLVNAGQPSDNKSVLAAIKADDLANQATQSNETVESSKEDGSDL